MAVAAFADDPFFSYLFPNDATRDRNVGNLHRAVMINLATLGVLRTAYVEDQAVGVALWIPPNAWPYPVSLQLRQLLTAQRSPGSLSVSDALAVA